MFVLPRRLILLFSIGLALVGVLIVGFGARSVVGAADSPLVAPSASSVAAAPTEARLHNPTFDNHIWYWFHERHGYGRNLVPDSFVPDDDTQNGPQQWWLWYYDGTVPILTWASSEIHGGVNAVKGRTYWDGKHQAGLYQMIYNATPCLTYEFQMYGKAKLGDSGDVLNTFRVGIDQRGYRPDTWAVKGFPSTMVWGDSHAEYVDFYGPLSVTAEARSSTISVFTYADADGGASIHTVWDTGSFRDATPAMIHDLQDLPSPGGVYNVSESVGTTTATITWETTNEALGQVYYRLVPSGGTGLPYTHTVYIPVVLGAMTSNWLATPLDKTPKTTHTATLTDLQPDSSYEYIAVSRGLFGDQCVTWVSEERPFKTNE